jgi:hypothetical protein
MNRIRTVLPALALIGMVAFGACGGGSGENSSPVAPDVQQEATATGYVSDVCAAAGRMFAAYQKSFQENRASLGGMDPTDAYARTARTPFAALVADLETLTPPGDVSAAHAETLRQAREVLDALNRGDRQKLLALRGTPDTGTWKQVVDLAPSLKTRFGSASQQVGTCQELRASGAGNPFE